MVDDDKTGKVFQAQPQVNFRLPEGPYDVEDNGGIVEVFQRRTRRPVLIMPRPVAVDLGWVDEEAPTSGTRRTLT